MLEPWQERLRELRRERGMRQQDVADAAGVSRVTISRMESEEDYKARRETMEAVAEAFGMEYRHFVARLTGSGLQGLIAELERAERRVIEAGVRAQHAEIDRIRRELNLPASIDDLFYNLHYGVTLDGYVTTAHRNKTNEDPATYWPEQGKGSDSLPSSGPSRHSHSKKERDGILP
jgi:transcriptional regulator with XRE-family HTH domain